MNKLEKQKLYRKVRAFFILTVIIAMITVAVITSVPPAPVVPPAAQEQARIAVEVIDDYVGGRITVDAAREKIKRVDNQLEWMGVDESNREFKLLRAYVGALYVHLHFVKVGKMSRAALSENREFIAKYCG